ncbi:unnamed protein product [Gongylonema pulchrum]|uniref:Uncharacterized protein n=1 Tax=Gongylonema pulchrum TaxID=637853 RepID=A0A3P7QSK6_9BILA|nr:unnamed protein product [Gongylonema pulchrum]
MSATANSVLSSASDEDIVRNGSRKDFWFAVPREKVDAIYHFLLQWNPEKYGAEKQDENVEELNDQERSLELLQDNEFVILDVEADGKLSGEFFTHSLSLAPFSLHFDDSGSAEELVKNSSS